LGGDCHTAIGAHAKIIDGTLHLSAMIGSTDGQIILRAKAHANISEAKQLGETVANDLITQGARRLMPHA
jgi:hydroxymethylbilane synthase